MWSYIFPGSASEVDIPQFAHIPCVSIRFYEETSLDVSPACWPVSYKYDQRTSAFTPCLGAFVLDRQH